MTELTIKDEYIKLGQALKKAGIAGYGSDAKNEILDGQVSVNGETELRRGRKLYDGDSFIYDGEEYKIISLTKDEL